MERDNLIRREPDAADRRRTCVVFTARARDVEDRLLSLSDHEVSAFMTTVARIINNLEAATDNRPAPQPASTAPVSARSSPRGAG